MLMIEYLQSFRVYNAFYMEYFTLSSKHCLNQYKARKFTGNWRFPGCQEQESKASQLSSPLRNICLETLQELNAFLITIKKKKKNFVPKNL